MTTRPTLCPSCGHRLQRVEAERLRTMVPSFSQSAADCYRVRVVVWVVACTTCEYVTEAPS
jgi:uncharacterized protein with PIN domain